jgi:hypothetical protein
MERKSRWIASSPRAHRETNGFDLPQPRKENVPCAMEPTLEFQKRIQPALDTAIVQILEFAVCCGFVPSWLSQLLQFPLGIDNDVLTVKYKDGEKTIIVTPETSTVRIEPGARSELHKRARIVAAVSQGIEGKRYSQQ